MLTRTAAASFLCLTGLACAGAPELPRVLPFPDGKLAAIAIVDDADGSGTSTAAPVYAALDKKGIRVTKTIFVFAAGEQWQSGGVEYSLEDPANRRWLLQLQKRGHEIALHGASAGDDERNRSIAALQLFREVFGHDPYVAAGHSENLERLYGGSNLFDGSTLKPVVRQGEDFPALGAVEGDPYFWGDVARQRITHYRTFYVRDLNTLAANPSMPYVDPLLPYVRLAHAVTDARNRPAFVELLQAANVEALKNERGAAIVYTHFSGGFYEPARKRLHPDFVETLDRLAADPQLWIAPVGEVLDRLQRFNGVRWDAELGRVVNPGDVDLESVTVLFADGPRIVDRVAAEGDAPPAAKTISSGERRALRRAHVWRSLMLRVGR